jgi:GDP-L-fucose synthase
MMNLREKCIAVTGGKGFLGRHLIDSLRQRGCSGVTIVDLPEFDLLDLGSIRRMYSTLSPEVVIHLAAKVGGIGFNQANPATLFYENASIGLHLIHEGYLSGVEKFVALGTICAYPKFTPVPFQEDHIWDGYPEETNAPYGIAKKMMLVQSQAYRQQYGFNSIFLLPVNLYGPGDNFSFRSSHVIPALIRKLHLATLLEKRDFTSIRRDFVRNRDGEIESDGLQIKITEDSPDADLLRALSFYGISQPLGAGLEPEPVAVEIWGSGKATREFLYVEDAAEAITLATESYEKSDPVNLGAGFEISIKDLASLLVKLTGFRGRIIWNTSKPDGQPRRMLDTRRARIEFGFTAKTSFEAGLKKTVEWYVSR